MLREEMTIKEATEYWVRGFNAIPQRAIERLIEVAPDEWSEVTKPTVGDRVYVYGESKSGEIIKCVDNPTKYEVKLDGCNKKILVLSEDLEVERCDSLPAWGTMWMFNSSLDTLWLEVEGGMDKMSDCGFRIYSSEDLGYVFGIDGGGYDFYEHHWIPLYKARGIQWHDPKTEKNV